MSLINQMLKEIDERGRSDAESKRSTSVYQGGRKPIAPWLFMLMGVVISVIVVLLILLFLRATNGSDDDVQVVRSEASPAESQTPVLVEQPESAAAERRSEPSRETTVTTKDTEEQEAVVRREDPSAQVEEPSAQVEEPSAQVEEPSAQAQEPSAQAQEPQQTAGEMSIQRTDTPPQQVAERSFQRGLQALEAGRGREAAAHFNDALSIRPGYVEAREQLAVYYYSQGFLSDALRVLEQGLTIAPEESRYLLLQARLLERADQPQMALELLREVAMQLPQHADLLILRGALASDLEDYELAVLTYEGLIAWRPQEGRWWLGLAIAYEQTNQMSQARQAYRRALEDPRLGTGSRSYIQQRLEAL